MNRKLLLALSLLFAVFACAAVSSAQPIDPDMAKQSTDILTNMRKVELLNQILPLVLEKGQINQILPELERIRDKQRKLIVQEHTDLMMFDRESSKAVDSGLQGKLPDSEYVREIEAFYKANDIRRQVAMGENLDLLMPVVEKALNKGQLKVMANALTLSFFEPDITPAEATDELKMRVFAREVLLDPLAYDLLVQMSK
jgi:hypothetical protein